LGAIWQRFSAAEIYVADTHDAVERVYYYDATTATIEVPPNHAAEATK